MAILSNGDLAALPIGTSNAQAFSRNAGDIDSIVNGLLSVETRTGKQVLSIDEAMRRIGYETPVAFASGISVTRATQTVISSGLTYHANPASLPFTTTGTFSAGQWMLVSNITAQDLASSTPTKGADLVYGTIRSVSSVSAVRALSKFGRPHVLTLGYWSAGDGGHGEYRIDSADATSTDNGFTVIVAADGGRWKLASRRLSVLQAGARRGDDSLSVAQANTQAFRTACLSMKNEWAAWQTTKQSRAVYVDPGDYNLSNGFSIPMGCSLVSDGIGVARLKVLGATADTVKVVPLVSLGSVINNTTGAVEPTTGAYVVAPAPHISDIYLNPQNSTVAISIDNVAGYSIGKVWIQANTAVNISSSSDGIIDQLIIEDSTITGVRIANSQNITINSIYTFLTDTPLVLAGTTQNVDIGVVQCNYTKVACVLADNGATLGRVRIADFACNQNAQFETFVSPVRLRSNSCDISFGNFDARNYGGYAMTNETGLGNVVSIDRLFLRQAPNSAGYTVGTTAKGMLVSNCALRVATADVSGLADSPFEVAGSFASDLSVNGGVIGSFSGTNSVVKISNSSTSSKVMLEGIDNRSGKQLFNAQAYTSVFWDSIKNPFPIIVEGARYAIKIPFTGNSGVFGVSISANTNAGGNAAYRRVKGIFAAYETSFSGGLITKASSATSLNSGIIPAYTPDIIHQLDVDAVGAGDSAAFVGYGHIVVSVSGAYGDVSMTPRLL